MRTALLLLLALLALAPLPLAAQVAAQEPASEPQQPELPPSPKSFIIASPAQTQTLAEAVSAVKQALLKEEMGAFAPLLTEETVRKAIRAALASFDASPRLRQSRVYRDVAPVYRQIVEKGTWPKGASFHVFDSLKAANGVAYEGLGLRLDVPVHEGKGTGFSLPILDIWYGRPPGGTR